MSETGETNEEATLDRASELADLLMAGLFDQFMRGFRGLVKDGDDTAISLTEKVNERIKSKHPDCGVKVVVSQRGKNDKHLVMITDDSAFFGDSFTITRQMFSI